MFVVHIGGQEGSQSEPRILQLPLFSNVLFDFRAIYDRALQKTGHMAESMGQVELPWPMYTVHTI